jgi:hypothetical protein
MTGFKSDTPAVATSTDSGLVTGVTNGLANIYTIYAGKQGTKQIRVVPNYQGQWQGSYVVRSCTSSGTFNNCTATGIFAVGNVLPASMAFVQTDNMINGNFFLGQVANTPISAQIAGDGGVTFTGTSTNSTTISADTTWRVNLVANDRLVGNHTQVFHSTVSAGTMVVESDIVDALARSGFRSTSVMRPLASRTDLFQALSSR